MWDKLARGDCGWEEDAINAMILEKPNNISGCQDLFQHACRMEEDLFGVSRTEFGEGVNAVNGLEIWACEDVVNMGLSLGEVGLNVGLGAQVNQGSKMVNGMELGLESDMVVHDNYSHNVDKQVLKIKEGRWSCLEEEVEEVVEIQTLLQKRKKKESKRKEGEVHV